MLNNQTKLLPWGVLACSVVFSMCDPEAWAMPNRASANPMYNYQDDLGQVTNVNQLRDVAPTDWAYEALRSLVDRYFDARSLAPNAGAFRLRVAKSAVSRLRDAGSHRCIAGFPNQTYRGSQPLTRYEFAAGLNSCLNQIERLIAASKSLSAEDLATIERLSQEFEAELASLGGRVDELETRTAVLEDNAFSITTKLNAEIVNYILGVFGDEKPDGTEVDDEITFSSRIRLNFDSSFTGRDRLRVRLQARNVTSPAESGGSNSLALNFEGDNDNDLEIDDLHYSFPISDRIFGFAGLNGVDVDDVFDVFPTMGVAYDTLSLFSAYNNPIYDNGNGGGAALGLNIEIIETVNLDMGYFAPNPADPEPGNGLFNGNYAAGANLNISFLEDRLNIALAYLRTYQGVESGYDLAGFVGTDGATDPFGDRANSANNYGFATGFQVLEQLAIGGYFGYTTASTIDDAADVDILNWSAYLTYSDLLKEGSALVVSFGQPPTLTDSSGDAIAEDPDSPYLLDLEYQYSLNDNIQLTPGGYVLFNPNGDSDNDTIYVGTLRTIFRF